MGSGYGFALSGILFIVWVVIGKPMGYSDDWWLIIGTTTGVIGTFNAAVLRFTLQQEERTLDKEYDRWAEREGLREGAVCTSCEGCGALVGGADWGAICLGPCCACPCRPDADSSLLGRVGAPGRAAPPMRATVHAVAPQARCSCRRCAV